MTDSDPVIAEIDLTNAPELPRSFVPVHLSDAPLVEDLLQATKDWVIAYEKTIATWGFENPWHVRFRDAIRAIEPEWTP